MKNRNKTKLPHLGWPAKKCDYRPLLYCCITTISSSFSNIRFVCIFICDHHISRRKKAQILPPPCSVILLLLFLKCQWFFFVSQSAAAALQTFYWEEYYLKLKHLKKYLHNQFSQGLKEYKHFRINFFLQLIYSKS